MYVYTFTFIWFICVFIYICIHLYSSRLIFKESQFFFLAMSPCHHVEFPMVHRLFWRYGSRLGLHTWNSTAKRAGKKKNNNLTGTSTFEKKRWHLPFFHLLFVCLFFKSFCGWYKIDRYLGWPCVVGLEYRCSIQRCVGNRFRNFTRNLPNQTWFRLGQIVMGFTQTTTLFHGNLRVPPHCHPATVTPPRNKALLEDY